MTINTEAAEPASISGSSRQMAQPAPGEKRRQRVVKLVMVAAVARMAVDRRTLAGVIVLAIAAAAAKGAMQTRGFPVLDWYRSLGQDKSDTPA
jgi:hypothetical protein